MGNELSLISNECSAKVSSPCANIEYQCSGAQSKSNEIAQSKTNENIYTEEILADSSAQKIKNHVYVIKETIDALQFLLSDLSLEAALTRATEIIECVDPSAGMRLPNQFVVPYGSNPQQQERAISFSLNRIIHGRTARSSPVTSPKPARAPLHLPPTTTLPRVRMTLFTARGSGGDGKYTGLGLFRWTKVASLPDEYVGEFRDGASACRACFGRTDLLPG